MSCRLVYSEGVEATYDPAPGNELRPSSRRPSRNNILSPSPGSSHVTAGSKAIATTQPDTGVEHVLQLLRQLYILSNDKEKEDRTHDKKSFSVRREEFESKKISNKLSQQVRCG